MTTSSETALGRRVGHSRGARVVDREDEDLATNPSYAIVVAKPDALASERVIANGRSVASYNPEYDPDTPLVEVAFLSGVGQHVGGWRDLEDVELAEAIADSECRTYSYPETRLVAVSRDACRFCGRRGFTLGATVTDSSGGYWAEACLSCYARLRDRDHDGCACCRREDPPRRKAEHVLFYDPLADGHARRICDECRGAVIANRRGVWEVVR